MQFTNDAAPVVKVILVRAQKTKEVLNIPKSKPSKMMSIKALKMHFLAYSANNSHST